MNKKLTVVITTFNRKDRLIAQLKSIFNQPLYTQIDIVICDNCSNYDVKLALNEVFSNDELSIIEIVTRPFNIGMIGNISSSFLYAKTKWMWLLSDDDETVNNSISTILESTKIYPDATAMKFTEISENTKRDYGEYDAVSIPSMLDFCKSNKIDLGNFIFMSNNIYNIERITPYLGSAFIHSYTYFPHMIPIITSLGDANTLKFIAKPIVYYKVPDVSASSNYLVSIYLGALSISDMPLNLSKLDFKSLRNFFKMNVFWEISNDFYNSTYNDRRFLYKKLYKSLFQDGSLKNILIYRIFDFQIFFENNSFSNFCFRLKEKLRSR